MSIAPQLRMNKDPRFDYCNGICSGGCTDIDVLFERRGRFLVIENKLPDEEIPLGQLIALRELNKRPEFTVVVVRGHPPDEIVSAGPLDGEQKPCDAERVRDRIQAWWDSQAA